MNFTFKVIKHVTQYLFSNKTEPKRSPHQLTSLPKYILFIIAHKLSFLDLYRFSIVNHQAYDRLCKSQDYWKSRAQTIMGEIPETQFDRNRYLSRFCSFEKIDYVEAGNQFSTTNISGSFDRVFCTKQYKATLDFQQTLCVERIMPVFRKDNDWDKWPNSKMVNIKSVICRDDHILMHTLDGKLYVHGRHPFTNPHQSMLFNYPTLLIENVTKIKSGKYNTIIWRNGKLYQTDVCHRQFGQHIPNTTFEPLDISAKQALPFSLGDTVYVTNKGAVSPQLYFKGKYGNETPRFISANVTSIYVQEPYVYWISRKGVLWQANLIALTPKRRIMDRVYKLSCSDECLWVVTFDSKLYHIQSNSLKTNLKNVLFLGDDVCDVEGHNNFVVVKKMK